MARSSIGGHCDVTDGATVAFGPQPPTATSVTAASSHAVVESIPAMLGHDDRFIQYNIFGNIFEVSAKYKPPSCPA
ncbi:hypothetical protein ACFX2I_025193 [Malus domestica]